MNTSILWFLVIVGVLLLIWAALLWNGTVNATFGYTSQSMAKILAVIGIILLLVALFMYLSDKGYFSRTDASAEGKKGKPGSPIVDSTTRTYPNLKPLSPKQ